MNIEANVVSGNAISQPYIYPALNEQLFGILISHTPAAVAILDRQLRYMFVSDRWMQNYGLGSSNIIGLCYDEVFPGISPDYETIFSCLKGISVRRTEDSFMHPDGSLEWVGWEIEPWRDHSGKLGGVIIFTDFITERKKTEEQLRHASLHDHLTGLGNRVLLRQNLEHSILKARYGNYSALLFIDLDKFKTVNDTLGHSVGDEALIEISQLLSQYVRAHDTMARVGGDEFAVLLDDTTIEQARKIAERMLMAVSSFDFVREGCSFKFGLSMGIIPIYGHQEADVIIALADMAMYEAKQQGGNRMVVRNIGG